MAVRSYIRVTYVALSHWGKPIATAHTFDDLKAGIDEYYGIGKDKDVKYLGWFPYESKYPDSYEGWFEYEVNDFNWDREIETVTIHCVDFYPYTKYEVDDDNSDATV